ncbi:hypothetical protein Fmac_018810 [Flemingia macrophylla]|uniref:Transmembrane protein n=1 Tax=Flemingia macrophylla TaxID=520843 RepID=A0ABD1M610_9FABA
MDVNEEDVILFHLDLSFFFWLLAIHHGFVLVFGSLLSSFGSLSMYKFNWCVSVARKGELN